MYFNKQKILSSEHRFVNSSILPRKGLGHPLVFHGVIGDNFREQDSPSWFNPQVVLEIAKLHAKFLSVCLLKDLFFIYLNIYLCCLWIDLDYSYVFSTWDSTLISFLILSRLGHVAMLLLLCQTRWLHFLLKSNFATCNLFQK